MSKKKERPSFRSKFLFGVDEKDVREKLGQLEALYEANLAAQKEAYLLELEKKQEEIKQLEERIFGKSL